MTEQNNGGQAFPSGSVSIGDQDTIAYTAGMTMRDWFAGHAIVAAGVQSFNNDATVEQNARVAANWAYCIADAMLEARK